MDDGGLPGYRHRAVGFVYDNLNRLLWLPHGSDGLDTALRTAGVDVTDDVRVAGGRARIVLTSAA